MTEIRTFGELRQAMAAGDVLCELHRPAVLGEYAAGFHYWLEPRQAGRTVPQRVAIGFIQRGDAVRISTRADGTNVYQLKGQAADAA